MFLALIVIPACSGDPTVGEPSPRFSLQSPSDGAIGLSGTLTFSWSVSHGATAYTLQISTDSGFSNLVLDQQGISSTSVNPNVTLNQGTVYFWRVIADVMSGPVTSDGAPFSFTTVAAVPGAFTLTSPSNLSTNVSTTPTFVWTSSIGTATYRLQVATDPGFGTLVAELAGLTTTSVTLTTPLSAMTPYFWRVRAESTSTTTATNAPFSFTTSQQGPGSFTMSQPSNGATAVPTQPVFIWTASSGATSYRLEVSTDTNFSTKEVDQSGITTTQFSPAVPLLQGRLHYWRVTASNAAGDTPASSSPFTFTTI